MRKKTPTDIARLRQVAKWYYKHPRLTNAEIATRLGIEVRNVNKMLQEAEDLRLFRIDIPETVLDCGPAAQLQERYSHLKEIIVVPSYNDDDYEWLVPRWGVAAATYFDKIVTKTPKLHVGITGGETIFEFCEAVTTQRREDLHIHTTALLGRGRLVDSASHVDPVVNATILWAKCGRIPGHCHYATVPPYDGLTRTGITAELDSLAKRKPIRDVIEDMDKIDVVFTSIGAVKPKLPENDPSHLSPKLTFLGLLQPNVTRQHLADEGAVGAFSATFFDKNGKGDDKKWRFFLTAGEYDPDRRGVEFFRRMVKNGKTVVLVAGGEHKIEVIKVAVKAQLCNVLITDYKTIEGVAGGPSL